MTQCRTRFAPVAAAALAVLVLVPSRAPAGESNPLPRWLEGLQVGPGTEFRLAVIHPIFVTAPAEGPRPPAFLAGTPAEALGIAPHAKDLRTVARVANFGTEPVWALPGDVLRLSDADYAVRTDTVTAGGQVGDLSVVRISAAPEAEKPREEPRVAGSIPGPALLWMLLDGAREKPMVAAADDLAKEAGLATPRRSPVELERGEKVAARVREYRTRFAALPKSTAAARRELAGYAVVLDGGFAALEVFPDGKHFQASWPTRLGGIAVEAALAELENGVIETDLAAPTDPDRFTSEVKDAMLALYGLTPETSKVAGLGTNLALHDERALGRAIVTEASGPCHLLWVRDPSKRRAGKKPEDPTMDPGVIDRKARPTEAEKRWRDRRNTRLGLDPVKK